MTIVNTSYSTLVDAWGDDFNASTKRSKKKTKKDPLCELYSQQYNDTLLPYTNRPKYINSPKYPNKYTLTQQDYDKYHGYTDIRKYSRNNAPLKNTVSQRSNMKHSVPVKTSQPIYTVNDDPNVYNFNIEKTIHKNKNKKKHKKKQLDFDDQVYQNYVDEELEEYPSSYINENENDVKNDIETNKIDSNSESVDMSDDSDSDVVSEAEEEADIEEEVRQEVYMEQDNSQYNYMGKDTDNNRIYLDFAIYSMSGILIIFMMEQFVQIGINIKQQSNSMILS